MANETIPTCDICGYPCRYGYETRTATRRELATGYQDEQIICSECIQGEQEEGYRDMAADAAMDMQEGY
jgi:hypothetical protein